VAVVPRDQMKNPALQGSRDREEPYVLDEQVGFALRQAQQRHTTIFAAKMVEDLTPTQWAALAKLREVGDCSQNHLGRLTAMDAATIKGVIDRLTARGFTAIRPDPRDGRRILVALTPTGLDLYDRAAPIAARITDETLGPLDVEERSTLVALLRRLA
jgi:MarR family transcriptional regulator, lower aerobic nicotinate degradation pathway regulator